jgi:DNA-binding NarL/FixJ family response regulator
MSGLPALPLVGRAAELETLRDALVRAAAGRGGGVLLIGEGGVGKSRLATAAAEEAAVRGFTVARGRAYPMESGVPYALFADALLPVLRAMPTATLAVLARGGEAELAYVFPALAVGAREVAAPRVSAGGDPAEFKSRLLWTIAQFVRAFAARQPLLIVLDDVQWADASSLELLHFLARQCADAPVLLVATLNDGDRRTQPALRALEQSLLGTGAIAPLRVTPLSLADTAELVRRAFAAETQVLPEFAALLYGWTRGNAYFLQEALRSLIESGRLRHVEGQWLGRELDTPELPATVRDAIDARLERLPAAARQVADVCAVLGTRFRYALLASVADMPENDLLDAIEELRRHQVLDETLVDGAVIYDFVHPMVRQALYAGLGLARARLLHAMVAGALEAFYGDAAARHAGELAWHYARGDARTQGPKAVQYLVEAGRAALARYASREAADYLAHALERLDALAADAPADVEHGDAALRDRVARELASARLRLGEFDAAIALLAPLLDAARAAGDTRAATDLRRRIGLAHYRAGRHIDALEHLDAAMAGADAAGNERLVARIRLARSACLQELGRAAEALPEAQAVLELADRLDDDALRASAHRALLLLFTWTGPGDRARTHGRDALALADRTGDREFGFSVHWALAVLEGMTGNAEPMARHIEHAERIADALGAPQLAVATADLRVEYHSSTGDWDQGIATGERAIALARSLNQRPLLVRLLVWTSLMRLGRGEHEQARGYIDEAWTLAGAALAPDDPTVDVHMVVPAYIGRAAYHLWRHEFEAAIRVGEVGLAIADRTGYAFWAIHRLLPTIAEAYCHLRDVDGAARYEARLRRDSERLGHRLGLAWADTCGAIVAWLRGDVANSAEMLRHAAESLEAIPVIPDAARLRRQLAGRLADLGDRDGALAELKRVHEIFAQLGAEHELSKTRLQFREVGAKPPAAQRAEGADGLTAREAEIARLVALRKSNKAIGQALGISPRTVSTHLSAVFRKLDVSTRAELADYIRSNPLPEDG